jgi:hypothetical protein
MHPRKIESAPMPSATVIPDLNDGLASAVADLRPLTTNAQATISKRKRKKCQPSRLIAFAW